MKLCFPVNEEKGLESEVYNHFGSAPMFVVYDSETKKIRIVENNNKHHAHGMCMPVQALGGETVDAVILGGIGAGARGKLNAMGIRVLKAEGKTIKDNVALFEEGKLSEITTGCGHHDHGHGCSHD